MGGVVDIYNVIRKLGEAEASPMVSARNFRKKREEKMRKRLLVAARIAVAMAIVSMPWLPDGSLEQVAAVVPTTPFKIATSVFLAIFILWLTYWHGHRAGEKM